MNGFENLLNNFVVQVLIGIGVMVALILLAEAAKEGFARRARRRDVEADAKIKADAQDGIEQVRQELRELKGTLLEHSLSLDRNMEGLSHRMEALERRSHHVQER